MHLNCVDTRENYPIDKLEKAIVKAPKPSVILMDLRKNHTSMNYLTGCLRRLCFSIRLKFTPIQIYIKIMIASLKTKNDEIKFK
jgi:hypothetical protein